MTIPRESRRHVERFTHTQDTYIFSQLSSRHTSPFSRRFDVCARARVHRAITRRRVRDARRPICFGRSNTRTQNAHAFAPLDSSALEDVRSRRLSLDQAKKSSRQSRRSIRTFHAADATARNRRTEKTRGKCTIAIESHHARSTPPRGRVDVDATARFALAEDTTCRRKIALSHRRARRSLGWKRTSRSLFHRNTLKITPCSMEESRARRRFPECALREALLVQPRPPRETSPSREASTLNVETSRETDVKSRRRAVRRAEHAPRRDRRAGRALPSTTTVSEAHPRRHESIRRGRRRRQQG